MDARRTPTASGERWSKSLRMLPRFWVRSGFARLSDPGSPLMSPGRVSLSSPFYAKRSTI